MSQLNLFGKQEMPTDARIVKRTEAFTDYDAFVAKFDTTAPKTTDDCYTPQHIYDAILEWLRGEVDIEGRPIERPFYPGGDYEKYEYPENCIVVDNPPFSLYTKILRFYVANKIDFFLFGPGLTLFTPVDCCYIVANVVITYHNGAKVNTGFATSLFPELRVYCAPALKEKLSGKSPQKVLLPPHNVVTSARLNVLAAHGVELKIPRHSADFVKRMQGGVLYGKGFLIADKYAAVVQAVREKTGCKGQFFELTPKEKRIIEELNKNNRERNESNTSLNNEQL